MASKESTQGTGCPFTRVPSNVPQDAFARFLALAQGAIQQNRTMVQEAADIDSDILRAIFINLHTMKGMSRNYHLKQLTEGLHQAEMRLRAAESGELALSRSELLTEQSHIQNVLDQYAYVNEKRLGRKSSPQTIEFTMDEFEDLLRCCQGPDPLFGAIYAKLAARLHTDAHALLQRLSMAVVSLAKDLGKEPPLVRIEAPGLAFTRYGEGVIESILTHLIRNAVDHGLETASVRLDQGKPPQGRIDIVLQDCGSRLLMSFRDDGPGLDMERLRHIGLTRGYLTPTSSLQDIGQLIFVAGLSSAQKVTHISGQGIGLDAVRNFVKKEGGTLTLHLFEDKTREGKVPFELRMELPERIFMRKPA